MTSVLSLKFYSFANNTNGDRGISNGCLTALSRHNLRMEINKRYEIKRKQQTVINEEQSKNNVVVKGLDYSKIDEIKQQQKDTKTRKNGVGSFSLVFDFKEQNKAAFDTQTHNELIEQYLQDIGLLARFELLEFVWHLDEKSIHCHLLFSGFDKIQEKFAVNDYFSPKGEPEPIRDKDGNVIYKKIANGKDRGKFELKDGEKVPKMEAKRRNGTQWLQDEYSAYLEHNEFIYSNKKEFSSMLQFPNGIWRNFDEKTKDAIYYFRDLENLYFETKKNNPKNSALEEIHKEMMEGVSTILQEARTIQEQQSKKKQTKTNLLRPDE